MATMSITRRFNNLSNIYLLLSSKDFIVTYGNIRGSMMGAVDDLWITGSTEHKNPALSF